MAQNIHHTRPPRHFRRGAYKPYCRRKGLEEKGCLRPATGARQEQDLPHQNRKSCAVPDPKTGCRKCLDATGVAGGTPWLREHTTNDEGNNYNEKIPPHMTYKSVLVPSNTGNTRRRRDDASARRRVEASKQCVLGTELRSTQRPQLNQASNDLEGIHRQSYFILSSGEHIPQVLLSNLARLPRFDRMTVQGIIDAQKSSKLQAILSRHTSTTFVADSGPMCDYLLPPLMSFDEHHAAEYRIQKASLRPRIGSFALYESDASNTAESATCNGDILVLEGFKNSTKAAFNVCKRDSILPSVACSFEYSLPNPERLQPRTRDQP